MRGEKKLGQVLQSFPTASFMCSNASPDSVGHGEDSAGVRRTPQFSCKRQKPFGLQKPVMVLQAFAWLMVHFILLILSPACQSCVQDGQKTLLA